MADLLVHQEALYISPLVPRQLYDLPNLLVHLHGAVAGEVLLEGLADALHIKVVGEAGYRRDTLAAVSLLDADVDLRCCRVVVGIFLGGGVRSCVWVDIL